MSEPEFYQAHLDRVSRSFAFCIRQLPQPLYDWVALSYLLCRIVDTVEDSAWTDLDTQIAAFRAFDEALSQPGHSLAALGRNAPAGLAIGEDLLLKDSDRLIQDFHALPPQVLEIIRELILSMSRGMQHFCRQRKDGQLRLSTLGEVNQYCFFVAGVVGELLAKLVSRVEPKFRLSRMNLLRAHHFGLFLQKVNLLKDQVTDEKLGRHLIPSREMVEESSHENAERALDFLLDLPKEQIEFRRFCAWSLFLGLEALRVARDSILRHRVLKVSRADMENLFARVEAALGDDGALRSLFTRITQSLGWSDSIPSHSNNHELPEWFLKLYPGPLDRQGLVELGISGG
jgi:phytoene/squalene synthetase